MALACGDRIGTDPLMLAALTTLAVLADRKADSVKWSAFISIPTPLSLLQLPTGSTKIAAVLPPKGLAAADDDVALWPSVVSPEMDVITAPLFTVTTAPLVCLRHTQVPSYSSVTRFGRYTR